MTRHYKRRLKDMIVACEVIRDAERLLDDAVADGDHAKEAIGFSAISYQLIVIGEAIRDLPETLMNSRPEVQWSTIDGPLETLFLACRELDSPQ